MIYTAEHVTAWHPDKICDQISDAILDACLEEDPLARVAVETMGGHGHVYLTGEVSTKTVIDFEKVALNYYYNLTGHLIDVVSNIVVQSPEIAQGVNKGGAGDQGIMVGYACSENEVKLPQEVVVARLLLEPFKVDAKSQVTINKSGKGITDIVLSVQGKTKQELEEYLREHFLGNVNFYCNNTGSFQIGGFESDAGVTGRKIVVDQYGPNIPVGGGAFSGKDPTKVDRSGAYMARFIALDILKKTGAKTVLVKLGYVIGKIDPIMVTILVNNKKYLPLIRYDCRPQAIIERFDLRRPLYADLAKNGHFGRKELAWEKV